MSSMTRKIPKDSDQHKRLVKALEVRIKFGLKAQAQFVKQWEQAEESVLAYLPESEFDALRRTSRERGQPRYTTLQIPYSYALLLTAHTYWTSVFFARSPVHQFAGRHGESEQQVQAIEALVSYQVEVGQMLAPYYIWLYDVGKYGVGILGSYWCVEDIQYSNLSESVDPMTGKATKIQETFRIPGYKGNKSYNVSPFDFIHDAHFPIGRFQEGEFCAVRKVMGWNEIVKRLEQGYYMNTEFIPKATEAGKVNAGSSALIRPEEPGSFAEMGDSSVDHPQSVTIWEVYVDLIQSEWSLGESKYPEKWVFTVTSDYHVVIGAQPLGAAHGQFPFTVAEAEVEGYGVFNRGIPEIIRPVQNTMDWLLNTHFYNVRASLNNQFLIDPSKVIITDAEDGGPGFIYRLRPEAYGSDVKQFFYQVPVQDVTQQHMVDLNSMFGIGERVMGINDQMFGAQSGGRKTATEVRTSTGFGVNRQKTQCEYMSAAAFSPHAQMLVQHSQQFYDGTTKLKIVGDLALMAGPQFVEVRPELIAGFFDFVPVDGTLPVDRMAMANLWQGIMNQMRAYPMLLTQFDIAKVFTHVAGLAGIRNINQFKVQVMPNGMLPPQAQAGNVIPLRGPGAPGASPQGGGAPAPTPPSPSPSNGGELDAGY
jgi:hypothetical protein